jgi:hypothetical protein
MRPEFTTMDVVRSYVFAMGITFTFGLFICPEIGRELGWGVWCAMLFCSGFAAVAGFFWLRAARRR